MSKVRLDSAGGWLTVTDRNKVPIFDINSHEAIDVQVLSSTEDTFVLIVDINVPPKQEPKRRWWHLPRR